MKSYTDIEQSKKLAEILPIESADMRFCFSHDLGGRVIGHYPMIGREPSMGTIPCWSLAALLNVSPQVHLKKYIYNGNTKYYVTLAEVNQYNTNHYDNPVDACVELIKTLHKEKLRQRYNS